MRRMTLYITLALAGSICGSGVAVQAHRFARQQASSATSGTDDQDSTRASQGPGAALRNIRENERLREQRLLGYPTAQ